MSRGRKGSIGERFLEEWSKEKYITLLAPRGWGKSCIKSLLLRNFEDFIEKTLFNPDDLERIEEFIRDNTNTCQGVLVLDHVGSAQIADARALRISSQLATYMDACSKEPEGSGKIIILALPDARKNSDILLSRTAIVDLERDFRDRPEALADLILKCSGYSWGSLGQDAEKFGKLCLRSPKNYGPFRIGIRILNELKRQGLQLTWEPIQKAYQVLEGEETGIFWGGSWTHESLKLKLSERVIGQNEALDVIAKSLELAYSPLHNPNKPRGAFLLLGPTGVGKTETAKALAEVGFGASSYLIRFDMGEFRESHSIARFIGAPPGYVGYGEGQLTQKLRERPRSVVLLDEIEKANESVHKFLLALLDEGRITDARGNLIDAREAIIIMTSNLTADDLRVAPGATPRLPKEFIGRVKIIQFNALNEEALQTIVKNRLEARWELLNDQGITMANPNEVFLCAWEYMKRFGAATVSLGVRQLDRVLDDFIFDSGLLSEIKRIEQKERVRRATRTCIIACDRGGQPKASCRALDVGL